MIKEQDMVTEFMTEAGQDCPCTPVIPSVEVQDFRVRLIDEELDELCDAFNERDIVEVADAIGDLLVVVLGTAVACGIEIGPVFNEIHRSNMTKFIDGAKRPDGKWIKGPSYQPPNLAAIIKAQQRS